MYSLSNSILQLKLLVENLLIEQVSQIQRYNSVIQGEIQRYNSVIQGEILSDSG
jgi:hypothetical protein